MKELITAAVLVLFAQLAVPAFAVPTSGHQAEAELALPRCRIACPDGTSLHPKECRCVHDSRPICPRVRCPPLPFLCHKCKVDKNGCRTCEFQCSYSFSRCPYYCPYGTKRTIDSNGCSICTCKSKPRLCPKIKCEIACIYGTLKDKNGCPTCQCKPHICPPLCKRMCPYGFKRDQHGCALCKCKPKPTVLLCGPICEIFCPHGNVLDSRGCPTCRCKPAKIEALKPFD